MVGASLLVLDCWLLFPYTDVTFEQSPRSRALKSGLIHFFFHPEQCFPLTDSSRIPPNHPNSSRTIPSEWGQSGAIDVGCSHSGQLSNLLVAHVSYLNRPSFSLSVTREISTSGLFGMKEYGKYRNMKKKRKKGR